MLLMIDSADHITGKTGLTVTVTLSKDGAAFGALGGSVAEISSGWYKVALNTTDTGTLGDLAFHATSAGADPTDIVDQVVTLLPGEAGTLTSAYDPAKTAAQAGDVMKISSGTGANQVDLTSGKVNVGKINSTAVIGTGISSDLWRA